MTTMSDNKQARDVLVRARNEVLRELNLCGQNGGTGRSQNYAPILVSLHSAIKVIDELEQSVKTDFSERMKAAKEAKAAKQ